MPPEPARARGSGGKQRLTSRSHRNGVDAVAFPGAAAATAIRILVLTCQEEQLGRSVDVEAAGAQRGFRVRARETELLQGEQLLSILKGLAFGCEP